MNKTTFDKYKNLCGVLKKIIARLNKDLPSLKTVLQTIANEKGTAAYTVKCPIVYNEDLDGITQDSEIKLILIGDNPGKKEQENSRYLIGPSGKIADGFFKKQSDLGIDFRKNVIILNKTPVHTPRTNDLKKLLLQNDNYTSKNIFACIEQSQKEMANLLKEFWCVLKVPIWITGYSEMRKNGLFESYTKTLCDIFNCNTDFRNNIFVFRHFSMNQFTIDLNQKRQSNESVVQCLNRIGTEYRDRIFA